MGAIIIMPPWEAVGGRETGRERGREGGEREEGRGKGGREGGREEEKLSPMNIHALAITIKCRLWTQTTWLCSLSL